MVAKGPCAQRRTRLDVSIGDINQERRGKVDAVKLLYIPCAALGTAAKRANALYNRTKGGQMDRPGINAGTGSPAMRCVYVDWVRDEAKAAFDWDTVVCGRPGVGMYEQKPYCDEHMREVEKAYWARQRNDQASQAD